MGVEGRAGQPKRDDPAFQKALAVPPAQLLHIAYQTIDSNGNGVITRQELVDSPFAPVLTRLWKEINTDGDEKIDQKEWRDFFSHMRERIWRTVVLVIGLPAVVGTTVTATH